MMLIFVSREEAQVIDLYRKIKDPYSKYLTVEFIRLKAKEETGEDEKIPKDLEKCDKIYTAFCLACKDVRATFPKQEQNCQMLKEMLEDLENSTKKDMEAAYHGEKRSILSL